MSVFGAVTDRELRLYEAAPWSAEAWQKPCLICPLLATRLVTAEGHALTVRCGTQHGVATHRLRVATARDLACWARALVHGSHAAAQITRQVYKIKKKKTIKIKEKKKKTLSFRISCLHLQSNII